MWKFVILVICWRSICGQLPYSPVALGWTWIQGNWSSSTSAKYGGPQGVFSNLSNPGSSGIGALFRNSFNSSLLFSISQTDIWEVDVSAPLSPKWRWLRRWTVSNYGVQGVETSSNSPPSRYCQAMEKVSTDAFLMFGGCWNGQYYNDLWKLNLTSTTWTWLAGVSGSNWDAGSYQNPNIRPGIRCGVNSFAIPSKSQLFVFGGEGLQGGDPNVVVGVNELWMFDLTVMKWSFISGTSNSISGNYGPIMSSSTLYYPSGRCYSRGVADYSGTHPIMYIYGGGSISWVNAVSDFWKFNTSDYTWTWLTGAPPTSPNQDNPSWTTQPFRSLSNQYPGPGARIGYGALWMISDDMLLMHGGVRNSSLIDDVWLYYVRQNSWVWVGGVLSYSYSMPPFSLGIETFSNLPYFETGFTGWRAFEQDCFMFGTEGSFWRARIQIQDSPAGYRLNEKGNLCLPCEVGKYSTNGNLSICQDCPFGKYNAQTGSSNEAACVSCSAGKFNSQTGNSDCLLCQMGTYSSGN
jgi:hypothetical protein